VDVSVNLSGAPAGASCTAGMPASAPAGLAYLQGAWCGGAYVNDPTARATFGVYRNTDRVIYQRENY
jgi:MSHA biogenesis protein MshQ